MHNKKAQTRISAIVQKISNIDHQFRKTHLMHHRRSVNQKNAQFRRNKKVLSLSLQTKKPFIHYAQDKQLKQGVFNKTMFNQYKFIPEMDRERILWCEKCKQKGQKRCNLYQQVHIKMKESSVNLFGKYPQRLNSSRLQGKEKQKKILQLNRVIYFKSYWIYNQGKRRRKQLTQGRYTTSSPTIFRDNSLITQPRCFIKITDMELQIFDFMNYQLENNIKEIGKKAKLLYLIRTQYNHLQGLSILNQQGQPILSNTKLSDDFYNPKALPWAKLLADTSSKLLQNKNPRITIQTTKKYKNLYRVIQIKGQEKYTVVLQKKLIQ